MFGDLADALAEAFPSVAPETEGEDVEDVEDEVEVEIDDRRTTARDPDPRTHRPR